MSKWRKTPPRAFRTKSSQAGFGPRDQVYQSAKERTPLVVVGPDALTDAMEAAAHQVLNDFFTHLFKGRNA